MSLVGLAVWFVVLDCLVVTVNADDDFPELYNSEQQQEASPMPAKEAARRMRLPEGLRIDVFASEPDVQNPIDMTWDARGRIWIAENYTYAERTQKFDLGLRDRVIVLEDRDGDGVADDRRVFTDQVQMLTSVEVGRGGVWLMCPPKLLFIPDRDGDDRPDGPAEVVLDGFTVSKENYHNFANGLRWGPDGWLYGRCGGSCPGRVGRPGTAADQRIPLEGGIWRYHPRSKQFEVLVHGTTNPWGHDWNDHGEGFFINTVNGHLWHLIPGAHFMRPFTLDPNPHVFELIDMHADHWHFDTQGSWTKSRDGAANEFGGGHAHVGMMIYLGDNWPSRYRDRLLTWNIHGRRANQEILRRKGSGYVAKHGKDLLLAEDPFFRGMELSYGPDGAVYAIDWSDTGECHEHTGVHRTSGRVFRIAATADAASKQTATKQRLKTDLRSLSNTQLAALIEHRNEWFVRQARLQLIERAEAGANLQDIVEPLTQMVADDDARRVYRALATLHATDQLPRETLIELLGHRDEHVRAWAVRLLVDSWPIDTVFGRPDWLDTYADWDGLEEVVATLQKQAEKEPSGLVRLHLASAMMRLPTRLRLRLTEPLLRHAEDANDHNLPLLLWYGLMPIAESDPESLALAALSCRLPKTQRLIARRLAERYESAPEALEILLRGITTTDELLVKANLMRGVADGFRGWTSAKQPKAWDAAVAALDERDFSTRSIARDLSVLFGDGRALTAVRELVIDEDADPALRRSALQTLVRRGGPDVADLCAVLLKDARLNVVAAEGLAKSNQSDAAEALVKNYRRFRAPQRPKVISILASRPQFAEVLLDAVAEKKIPADDLTAYDVRQIRSLESAALNERVGQLWGELRDSPAEKRQRIDQLKQQLTSERLASANLGAGRQLFNRSCAKCHRLFGFGEKIGPELTGANRNNLDYLLENIVDPSAVVSTNYRMTVFRLVDGRVLNGLELSRNDKTVTLQTQNEKVTLALDEVEESQLTSQSPMPAGLLDNLTAEQIRDLIAYLGQPSQTPLPTQPLQPTDD